MNRSYSRTLTGATPVTSITADASQFGDELKLIATAAAQQLTNGSNLNLDANWVTTAAGDTITLVCDGANWCEVARRHPSNPIGVASAAAYRLVLGSDRRGTLAAALTSSSRYMLVDGVPVGATAATAQKAIFPITAAQMAAPTGYALKMALEAMVTTNNTSPASTFTFALVPVLTTNGAAGVNAFTTTTPVTGASVAITPGANANGPPSISSDFTTPADGNYVLRIINSATIASGGDSIIFARLLWRWV